MASADPAAERKRSAALRLKHDLGKGIRFRAPKAPEPDDGALRERLGRDLKATRETPEGTLSAPEVFARWKAEEAAALGEDAPEVKAVGAAIAEIEGLLPRLATLDREGLLRLDALARCVGELTATLFARVGASA